MYRRSACVFPVRFLLALRVTSRITTGFCGKLLATVDGCLAAVALVADLQLFIKVTQVEKVCQSKRLVQRGFSPLHGVRGKHRHHSAFKSGGASLYPLAVMLLDDRRSITDEGGDVVGRHVGV